MRLHVKVGGGEGRGVEIARTHVTVSSSQLRLWGVGTADKMWGGETDPNRRRREHSGGGGKLGASLTQECGAGRVT